MRNLESWEIRKDERANLDVHLLPLTQDLNHQYVGQVERLLLTSKQDQQCRINCTFIDCCFFLSFFLPSLYPPCFSHASTLSFSSEVT